MHRSNRPEYLQRLLLTLGIIALFFAILSLLWILAETLLLVFIGVLVAIVLRTLAKPIARYSPLSAQWALIVVLAILAVGAIVGGWLLIPEIISQVNQLVEGLQVALVQVEAFLSQFGLGQQWFDDIFSAGGPQPFRPTLINRITGTFTQTLGILANLFFIGFIGLFVAIDPEMYRRGIVRLVPPRGRSRTREIIDSLVAGMRAWLLGRVISMVAIGVAIGVGLRLMGIPLALVLGLLTGLLEFIPIVGPILSAGPAILIAITLGFKEALYVAIFYLVMQQLEGNVLTPIVQQKTVHLPPALTLTAVLAMGFLFGPLGVLVATPVAAVLYILVKELYLKDLIERDRH